MTSEKGFAFLGADVSLLGYAEATEKDLDFEILLNTAVDFRKWLRFPRGAAGASSATPAGSPPSAISLRSLRLLLQSTARNRKKHYVISFSVAWLRMWGLHLALFPSGVYAICSNDQLGVHKNFGFSVF
ncbi:hypothetical protein AAV98_02310 [Bacillus sp. CHD6a]|nr:hypothetical protein AAV98_02310 [Bacillus sp. CHD6a]